MKRARGSSTRTGTATTTATGDETRELAFSLETPADFGFDATVRSHGWYDLPPFRHDAATGTLETAVAVEVPGAGAMLINVDNIVNIDQHRPRSRRRASPSPAASPGTTAASPATTAASPATAAASIAITSAAPRTPGAPLAVRVRGPLPRARAEALVRSILQLDHDLGPLHAALARDRAARSFAWVRAVGAGRLLRSPTAFEDLVKVLCTTNCTWAGTRAMVSGLVALGPEAPGGLRAFPSATALAARDASFLRERARMGYRAESLVALARAAAGGTLDCEALRGAALSTDDLHARVLALRGFGPYATDQVLRLAGRFDRPALDSAMRAKWRELHPRVPAARATDAAIVAGYLRRFGAHAALALWLELTADWHGPGTPAWPPPVGDATFTQS